VLLISVRYPVCVLLVASLIHRIRLDRIALADFSVVTIIESESYVMTDDQSASLSWNKAPIWGLRPDIY
jgi:hypothetical protein